ncbi:MAG: amidoligase family protein [Gammaproteobacteria bacterium]|nr:amidoligase family protein [Gammaproteobacteria bacterium]
MIQKNKNSFGLPPRLEKADGGVRRVGFELEFSGILLEQAADTLIETLNASIESKTAAEIRLHAESIGDFNVELDWNFLKRVSANVDEKTDKEELLNLLSQAASLLVPLEVVCPPIPITRLQLLKPMTAALREAGAVGTEESLLAAYGVHINTEIPELDANTLSRYLKAFAVLQWWLVDAHEVDVTRKISPYIDLYPEAYLRQLLAEPEPTMEQIFDDYLEYNASRNRALDLLPILAEIDKGRVGRDVDDPRVNARPAFHYRMPNCNIEQPDWSLSRSWNTWLVVENLATEQEYLDELGTAFLAAERPLLGVHRSDWVKHIDRWLQDHALA